MVMTLVNDCRSSIWCQYCCCSQTSFVRDTISIKSFLFIDRFDFSSVARTGESLFASHFVIKSFHISKMDYCRLGTPLVIICASPIFKHTWWYKTGTLHGQLISKISKGLCYFNYKASWIGQLGLQSTCMAPGLPGTVVCLSLLSVCFSMYFFRAGFNRATRPSL